jgi:hypothetical protein
VPSRNVLVGCGKNDGVSSSSKSSPFLEGLLFTVNLRYFFKPVPSEACRKPFASPLPCICPVRVYSNQVLYPSAYSYSATNEQANQP